MRIETLLDGAGPSETIGQLRYLRSYLGSDGGQGWRERLGTVRFPVNDWLGRADTALAQLQSLDADTQRAKGQVEIEALDLAGAMEDARAWFAWLRSAVHRVAYESGGPGGKLVAQVDVGGIASLGASATARKLRAILIRIQRYGVAPSLDPEELAKARRILARLEVELGDGADADAGRTRAVERTAEALVTAHDAIRDLALARDEAEKKHRHAWSGLKLGILAAAAARQGRPRVEEEEDPDQLAEVPAGAASFLPTSA